jgi:transcriptional regulator with XRE-family HTH domain
MPRRVGKQHPRRRHFLREWREARGLSLDELADRMGTSKGHLSNVENLKNGYTQDFIEAAAIALDTDAASLISRRPGDGDDILRMWKQATGSQRATVLDIMAAVLRNRA